MYFSTSRLNGEQKRDLYISIYLAETHMQRWSGSHVKCTKRGQVTQPEQIPGWTYLTITGLTERLFPV